MLITPKSKLFPAVIHELGKLKWGENLSTQNLRKIQFIEMRDGESSYEATSGCLLE